MYLCDPNYDSVSNQMEFANCLGAEVGADPSAGQTSPTFGNCNGGGLSAVSAAYKAEDVIGIDAYTIPVYTKSVQYGFRNNGWTHVINAGGTNNYFSLLNAWNRSPAQPGSISLGLSTGVHSLNPYIASNPLDISILGGIYDSLTGADPYDEGALINWMADSALPQTSLTYTPPPGTVLSYRFTFRPNLNFQDGTMVTAFDVAFSYLSLLGTGSILGDTLSSVTGITVLSPTQFDLNLNIQGPFVLSSVTAAPILPGRWWTSATPSKGANGVWDNDVKNCGANCFPAQYTLSGSITIPNSTIPAPTCALNCGFPGKVMWVNPAAASFSFDPVANNILIGTGPWQCGNSPGSGANSGSCTTTHTQGANSYTFVRNGKGITPGFPGDYFRSSGFLATYLWSGDGICTPAAQTCGTNNFSAAKQCFGVTPLTPLGSVPDINAAFPSDCAHWQQGIGTNGATTPAGTGGCPGAPNTSPCGIPVGANQLSIIRLYLNVNWVDPFVWNSVNSPLGIIALDPVLYEGAMMLNPASVNGCSSPYPSGGYDC